MPDDYKPNALFHDQGNGDLHCFIARGTGPQGDPALANRRRAWLLSSADKGRSWNTGALSPLGREPAFDATAPDGLVPVGACNHRGGSVQADGHVYLYFNHQGNPKSFDLYPTSGSRPELKPVYCGRAQAPSGRLSAAERARHFADPRSWSFRTARGGWSGPGDLAAAAPVHEPEEHMGKHFLAWWVPALDAYVAAKTHSLHRIWLGVADQPWGPFREVMDRELGESDDRGQLKFTAQLLPSPGIAGRDGTVFPLIVSGAPYYDGLGLARIRFSRAR